MDRELRQIVGVDGCKAGWLAAIATVGDIATPRLAIFSDIAALLEALAPDALIAIDMPIGLQDHIVGPGRAAERLVRPLLGARQSSVFAIPARKAVEAASYADACHQAVLTSDPPRKVSKQAFYLFGKVRELDQALRGDAALVERLRETHPEVVFRALHGGSPLAEPKKVKGRPHEPGLDMRRKLLLRAGVGEPALRSVPPRGAGVDDLLDSIACLVTARAMAHGTAESFPDPPLHDAHGLPMAIVAPRPHTLKARIAVSGGNGVITRNDIEAAAGRIAAQVRVTPVMELARGELGGDFTPVLKLEFLQHAGSFKPRGAFNNLLSRPVTAAGVAAASGGNHGAAVAYAALKLGHRARIFVPEISSPAKIDAIRRFGAEVVIGGARYDDAQAACDAYVAISGALKVHPFAAPETLAGQGTLAREWEAQSGLDTVLIAVGGGGLIGGAAAWWRGSGVKVVGVEPEGSRALHAALAAGGPVDVNVESVAADSLGARNVGQLVYDTCAGAVDHVALVPDTAITQAQGLLWRDFRIASEPGGAAAFAAILSRAYVPSQGERVGILLCGANVALAKLNEISA